MSFLTKRVARGCSSPLERMTLALAWWKQTPTRHRPLRWSSRFAVPGERRAHWTGAVARRATPCLLLLQARALPGRPASIDAAKVRAMKAKGLGPPRLRRHSRSRGHRCTGRWRAHRPKNAHLSLHKDAPVRRDVCRTARVRSSPILGGLHHQDVRV
jgi:hypothetical protein